jgi:hypothetical protein
MANTLLTINMITREAVRLWKQTNSFIRHVDTQYDDSFAQTGAKIGQSLRIRLPNDFTVRTGPAASVQDTAEQSTTLVLATQKGVDVSYSSVDRTMSLDDFSRRILAPMVNNLVGHVAYDVMQGVEAGACNLVANTDGSGNILTPTSATWLRAGASLANNLAPMANRKVVFSPSTQADTVASLAGLFNPSSQIGKQTEEGEMFRLLGFDWFMDQTVLSHTTASYSGSLTVSGANQTGTVLTVGAITGGLAAGEIITIAGVYAVNRITKQSTGQLRQFVVTAPVASGGTSINIYPAIVPAAANGSEVQYQTVTASPANNATISVATLAGSIYQKNIAFSPDAVTMATADLELPRGVHEAAREEFDGVSMRMISAYDIRSDQFITRLDVLYGYLWVRPEWVVVVADNAAPSQG